VSRTDARRARPVSYLSYTDGFAERWRDFLLLVGRVLMAWIFVASGWRKLMDLPAFAKTMPRRGLPELLGYVAAPVEFIGGICLLVGFATRYAALMMLLFVIIASFSSHRYWDFTDPVQYANQSSNFWKNVTIKGGLVLLFITGAGRFALDRILRKGAFAHPE
jgi:putative oxidoreductase